MIKLRNSSNNAELSRSIKKHNDVFKANETAHAHNLARNCGLTLTLCTTANKQDAALCAVDVIV